MIISVQGYNRWKNDSALAASVLGGICAETINSDRTLIIQLIEEDPSESVEKIIDINMVSDENSFGKSAMTLESESIDSLLIYKDGNQGRITKEVLSGYVTPMTYYDNKLDVTRNTRNTKFLDYLKQNKHYIKEICNDIRADNIYDNIILLLPSNCPEIIRYVNGGPAENEDEQDEKGFADISIYCIRQGHKPKTKVYGRKIAYLIMDYDSMSQYKEQRIKKEFCKNGEYMFKLERNIRCTDAKISGKLLSFIDKNTDLSDTSNVNYNWICDAILLRQFIRGEDIKNPYIERDWEKYELENRSPIIRTISDERLGIDPSERIKSKEEEFMSNNGLGNSGSYDENGKMRRIEEDEDFDNLNENMEDINDTVEDPADFADEPSDDQNYEDMNDDFENDLETEDLEVENPEAEDFENLENSEDPTDEYNSADDLLEFDEGLLEFNDSVLKSEAQAAAEENEESNDYTDASLADFDNLDDLEADKSLSSFDDLNDFDDAEETTDADNFNSEEDDLEADGLESSDNFEDFNEDNDNVSNTSFDPDDDLEFEDETDDELATEDDLETDKDPGDDLEPENEFDPDDDLDFNESSESDDLEPDDNFNNELEADNKEEFEENEESSAEESDLVPEINDNESDDVINKTHQEDLNDVDDEPVKTEDVSIKGSVNISDRETEDSLNNIDKIVNGWDDSNWNAGRMRRAL